VFSCLWLLDEQLGEDWRPDRAGFVLYLDEGGRRMLVHVDPDRPDAWRRQPYANVLGQWARRTGHGFSLAVLVGGTVRPIEATGLLDD